MGDRKIAIQHILFNYCEFFWYDHYKIFQIADRKLIYKEHHIVKYASTNEMILFNATVLKLKKYESRLTKRILMIKEVSQIVICQQEQIIKEQPQKEMPFKHS